MIVAIIWARKKVYIQEYLHNQTFKKQFISICVIRNVQKFLASSFSHGIHQIILCLKNLDAGCIQLHWVLTAMKNFSVTLSSEKTITKKMEIIKPQLIFGAYQKDGQLWRLYIS